MIGLGIGLYRGGRGSGAAPFDIASLSWSGLWTAPFGASPWEGTASAGASGGRDLTEATNPPSVGALQNGLAPAEFDGSNDRLMTGLAWSSLIAASSFFFDVVARPITTAPATSYDADPCIIGDTDGYCGVALTDEGFSVFVTDGGPLKRRTIAFTPGAYNRFQAKLDGGVLAARIDGGAWSTLACGNVSVLTSLVHSGRNYNATTFVNARLLQLGVSSTAFSDAVADQIDAYNTTRFGL